MTTNPSVNSVVWLDTNRSGQDTTSRVWRRAGVIHREGGPAIICDNGKHYWYLSGVEYHEHEYWPMLWSGSYVIDSSAWLSSYKFFTLEC